MRAKCSVTFEFDVRAPVTWKGEMEGEAAHTVGLRAIREAQKVLQPRNWSSMVFVILERDNVEKEIVDEEDVDRHTD